MENPKEYHQRPQTASQIIETKQLPIDIPLNIDADGDWDETFVQVLRVIHATNLTIEGLGAPHRDNSRELAHEIRHLVGQHEIVGTPEASDAVHHNFAQALTAAFRCGEDLLARDDVADLQEDFSQIDDETLADVHLTIGYVSGYFGIDLDLSAPAGDES